MTARKAFISLALLTLLLVGLTVSVRALPRPVAEPVSPLDVDSTPTMTASVEAPRPAALWWRVPAEGPVALRAL